MKIETNLYEYINRRKKGIFIIIVLILLSGCQITPHQNTIYDQDDKIVSEGDSFYFTDRLGAVNDNNMELTFKRFYGVQTIWMIEATEDILEFNVKAQIESGEFKVVLITPDQQIVNLTEEAIDGHFRVETVSGEYRLKIVGRNANGMINISFDFHKNP